MDEQFGTTLDNSTQITTSNTTVALPTVSTSQARQTVSVQIIVAVGLLVFSIGACANAGVLAVLVRAGRHSGSSVHTMIANQCALDLYTCVFGIATLIMMITHGFTYNGNRILDGAICILF